MACGPDVLVIGGGVTGLAAAYELTRRGCRPLVLESSPRAGGLIRTDHADGFTIEAGPDSLLTTKPAALELVRELGLESEIQTVRPPGGAFVLRGRTLYALPRPSRLGIPQSWAALARYSLLPPAARVRLALEPLIPARRDREDESIGSFFRRRFGAASVDLIAQPLLGGIHAGDIETLSMQSLFPRLLEIERTHGSVLRAPADPSPGASPGISPFASLRGGMGTLVHALERRLEDGMIRYGSPIDRVVKTERGWRAGTDEARALIVAIPATAAAGLLAAIDADAAALCTRVPYVSTASVALAWPRTAIAHPLAGTGFVVARRHSDVRITACTWVSSKWEDRAPEGTVLLRAFLGGAHDPDVVSLTDDALLAAVRGDLDRVLGITGAPILARVHRWPHAGAQHTVGHLARVETIERRLAGHGGLFVAGSGFRAVGIPDCIADARRAAAAAAAFLTAADQHGSNLPQTNTDEHR
jgi:protoporphyrinogen/coproporphyrinogen III oxidase